MKQISDSELEAKYNSMSNQEIQQSILRCDKLKWPNDDFLFTALFGREEQRRQMRQQYWDDADEMRRELRRRERNREV